MLQICVDIGADHCYNGKSVACNNFVTFEEKETLEVFMNSKFIKKGIVVTALILSTVAPVQSLLAWEKEPTAVVADEKIAQQNKNVLINVAARMQDQKKNNTNFIIISSEEIKFNQRLLNRIFVATEDESTLVYAEPSEESTWVGKAYGDTSVDVIENGEEWCLVTTGNVSGYVKAENLIVGNVAIEQAKNILKEMYVDRELIELSDEEIDAAFSCGETKEEEDARIAKEEEEKRIAAELERQQKRSAVVAYAKQFVGNPYVYGGTSLTRGTDCSGFVKSVYKHFGVNLPRTSTALRSAGYRVSVQDMQPGDIVCYSGHVGIYVGNGKIVNAIDEAHGIGITNAYYKPIITVRRIF